MYIIEGRPNIIGDVNTKQIYLKRDLAFDNLKYRVK